MLSLYQTERYEANTLCQHPQIPIEYVQWVFEILMELKIYSISHYTYINFCVPECNIHWGLSLYQTERYEANTLCQHSQTPIEYVQWVFEILLELKIGPISHHTLTFVYQDLMYIEGCNSIKQKDMKQILCVSIHRHI